ncbi:vWA domain-containing protein [Paractinoplanes lichenicola]|uniref:VWA domain-containing protein n=1 Tax=Paractinoplanes lichenicola TaxID=2802976 RepID=A0ABS1VUM8_9ACTN|nr:VWA domain-containing protein [Actinoplanes lichenicola]MBL7258188.1 VWA domain-containing protein [Actinoplanes lichenicola]
MPGADPSRGGTSRPVLLRGTDRAALAVALVARLRRAGIPTGLTETGDFVHALEVSPPLSLDTLYWTARVSLVRRQPDLAAFDKVFAAVFADAPPLPFIRQAVAPAARRDDDVQVPVPADTDELADGSGLPWATLPPVVAAAETTDTGLEVPDRRPSALAALAELPFEDLDATQTGLLGEALRAALIRWPTRRTRRHRPDPAGRRVALRPTIARARRTAWEPAHLVRERPLRRPRRAVLLCDVSESMRAQATAYLHLMRAFTLVAEAEVFAFATTLTRLTPALRHTNAAEAVARAGELVTDRFGGTRIATNVAALLDSHHGNTLRGALVIVASDGWDSDPPELMTAAMTRLRRRAHRVLWLNPRASAPGFAPRVAGMAAALPFCDRLLPAATFQDLAAAAHLLQDPSAPGGRGLTARVAK